MAFSKKSYSAPKLSALTIDVRPSGAGMLLINAIVDFILLPSCAALYDKFIASAVGLGAKNPIRPSVLLSPVQLTKTRDPEAKFGPPGYAHGRGAASMEEHPIRQSYGFCSISEVFMWLIGENMKEVGSSIMLGMLTRLAWECELDSLCPYRAFFPSKRCDFAGLEKCRSF